MDIINICSDNIIYPDGEWTLSAKNPTINGNLLCAQLKNVNGVYESSCIIFNKEDKFININGRFAKMSNKIPEGEWKYSNNYYEESVYFKNGKLCAKLLRYKKGWIEDCIYVGENDRVGISYWDGFYRY